MTPFDQSVFHFINQQMANPFLDAVLPVYRDKLTWIPLYALLVWLMYRRLGWRQTLYVLICTAGVIAVADQIAASLLKPWVGRLRPCADPQLVGGVRELVGCGGQYGFPSNHATNHFALATVLSMTFLHRAGWRIAVFLWALSIALAQVYVGKHYPSDILAGALLGVSLGIIGVYVLRALTRPRAVT